MSFMGITLVYHEYTQKKERSNTAFCLKFFQKGYLIYMEYKNKENSQHYIKDVKKARYRRFEKITFELKFYIKVITLEFSAN